MADLEHLLDELDQAQQDPQLQHDGNDPNDPEFDALQPSVTDDNDQNPDTNDNHNSDEDDDSMALAAVPPALREAQDNLQNPSLTAMTATEEDTDGFLMDLRAHNGSASNKQTQQQQYQAYLALMTWWKTELHSPELQPWQDDLMNAWLQTLEECDNALDEAMNAPPLDDDDGSGRAQKNALLLSLKRMDRQRLQFVVHNLLGCRLGKIQRYHSWLVLEHTSNKSLLGEAEWRFCQDFHELWEQQLQQTVTSHFAQTVWKALDEPDMVATPNLGQYVWVKFRESAHLQFSQSQLSQDSVYEEDDWQHQRYDKGTILVLPYNNVKELLSEGKVELLM